MNFLSAHLFTVQVRIPSKSDKPGGSPVKQAAKEVSGHSANLTDSVLR